MIRRLLAEFTGTFFLVLAGPGAIMVEAQHPGAIGPLGIALAFGLIVAIMVFTLGPVSGAHINPAVTIAVWSVRRLPFSQVASYVIAQLSGALVASLAARALLGPVASNGATIPHVGVAAAFIVEALLSLLVILSVLAAGSAGSSRAGAAVMIGMTIGLCALVGGPLTGAKHESCEVLRSRAGQRDLDVALGVLDRADRRNAAWHRALARSFLPAPFPLDSQVNI